MNPVIFMGFISTHNLYCLQNGLIDLQRDLFSMYYLYKGFSLSVISFREFIHS